MSSLDIISCHTYRSGPWNSAWPSVIFDLRKSITSREEGPTSTLSDWVSSAVKKSVTVDRNAICWSVDSCLPAASVLVCVCSNRNLFFLYLEMQSKFAYPGSLYKCCYISITTLRYFLHRQGMLYHSFYGAEIIWTSLVNAWMADQGTQNHESSYQSMCPPTLSSMFLYVPSPLSFSLEWVPWAIRTQSFWAKLVGRSLCIFVVSTRTNDMRTCLWAPRILVCDSHKSMRNSKLTFPVRLDPCPLV